MLTRPNENPSFLSCVCDVVNKESVTQGGDKAAPRTTARVLGVSFGTHITRRISMIHGNMAEWSKALESGHSLSHLVLRGVGSSPTVVIVLFLLENLLAR